MKIINILNKTYFKNNSCDDQFLISQLAFFDVLAWLLVYVYIPFLQGGFNSLPETQRNTYLLSVFHQYQYPCQNKMGPLMCYYQIFYENFQLTCVRKSHCKAEE